MLNVIFSLIDIRGTLTEEQENFFRKQIDFVRPLPESRKVDNRIMYQANINNLDQLEEIKILLEQLDSPSIIGIWYKEGENTGLQYGYKRVNTGTYENPVFEIQRDEEIGNIIYPFNLDQYCYYLNDIVTRDENGYELERRRPTNEEAQNTQVNMFASNIFTQRDLNLYV